MAKITRFEELQSWQKGRQPANLLYDLTEYSKFVKDFRLSGQIQGAAGSAMHNIAEGLTLGRIPNSFASLKYRDAPLAKCNPNFTSRLIAITLTTMN